MECLQTPTIMAAQIRCWTERDPVLAKVRDYIVAGATSASTMEKMRVTFATHGLPKTLVTDNGLVFTSAEFWEFLKRNGIRHVTSAPYHPTSNGLAECAVQVFKEGMREGNGRNTQNEGGTIPPEVPDHPTLGDGTTPS